MRKTILVLLISAFFLLLPLVSLKQLSESYASLTTSAHKLLDFGEQAYKPQLGTIAYANENAIWPFVDLDTAGVVIPLRRGKFESVQAQPKIRRRSPKLPVVVKELTDPSAIALQYGLYEQSITVLNNKEELIPFRDLENNSFASLSIGLAKGNAFQQYLDKYAAFQHFAISDKDTSAKAYDALIEKLKQYKVVVVGLHDLNESALQNYGIHQSSRTFIERLRTKTNVALVVFGTPYSLKYFDRMDYLLCAYEDNSTTQKLAPQILFGAIAANGKLPVTVTAKLQAGTGLTTQSLKRLGYTVPERMGLSSATLQRIDRIVENCIADSVMPGCQVLVARKGKVVFEKAYGYMTYDKKEPVTNYTIYDLASVTKVAATLQAVMSLYGQGKLDIHRKISAYLPELKGTNKEKILIQDLLLHQGGLIAFQEHWMRTKRETSLDSAFYSSILDDKHPVVVAKGIYGIASLKDSLWNWTVQSNLLKKPRFKKSYPYKYSDVGFDILQRLVERVTNQPMNDYLSEHFYGPLGLDELTFNPLNKFDEGRIAPTEQDLRFRGMLVRGTVHDQEAALMGGVAGHAGLFGTANDLAKLMQMNLQNGYYGGRQYLKEHTIPVFTRSYQNDNPRGLGWDRPLPEGGGGVSELASKNSFGHTGFTGTCVWVDPDEDMVYIFLSNRVYPNAENNKLARYKVRQKIQSVIYESLSGPSNLTAGIKPESAE